VKIYRLRVIPVCEHCAEKTAPDMPISLFEMRTNCGEQDGITYEAIEAMTEEEAQEAAALHYTMDDPTWRGRLIKESGYPHITLMVISQDGTWKFINPSA